MRLLKNIYKIEIRLNFVNKIKNSNFAVEMKTNRTHITQQYSGLWITGFRLSGVLSAIVTAARSYFVITWSYLNTRFLNNKYLMPSA